MCDPQVALIARVNEALQVNLSVKHWAQVKMLMYMYNSLVRAHVHSFVHMMLSCIVVSLPVPEKYVCPGF